MPSRYTTFLVPLAGNTPHWTGETSITKAIPAPGYRHYGSLAECRHGLPSPDDPAKRRASLNENFHKTESAGAGRGNRILPFQGQLENTINVGKLQC